MHNENVRRAPAHSPGITHCTALFVALGAAVMCSYAGSTPAASRAAPAEVASPDGRVRVAFHLDEDGVPRYVVKLDGRTVLEQSRLGLVRQDADFSRGLRHVGSSKVETVRDRYELLTAKRRVNNYEARRQVHRLAAAGGQPLEIQFQVSNDGVAFRHVFPDQNPALHRIESEATSFNFPEGARAWLQPIARAKTGWGETNPSYEENYEKDIAVGTPSPTGAGWVYPALFRAGETWLLVSETGVLRNYSGTRLLSHWRSTEYTIGFPDPLEHFQGGAVAPQSTLPWTMPWRLIVVGDLKTVVESTLGTDLAPPPSKALAATRSSGPGRSSWSWPLLGDDQTVFETQKRFVDYAAEMGWEYTLVDAMWDQQIGYDKLAELAEYARARNVRILVWYNSAGDWNSTFQTPRDVMLTRASRLREFERLQRMGIAGLKVDFFGGDGQSVMEYYQDILEDAARFGLTMNFHGSTLPRGWQRTYPNLMTMEAVRGLEFITFDQRNAEEAPAHASMLPFTRNVFDPMDFTPVVLDRIRNIERRTSSAFELAQAVLFTSGIQHFAEIPEGMGKAPAYVREFLAKVPAVWDDIAFLDGFPGQYVVLARRSGARWYVAGINGERTARDVELDLSALGTKRNAVLITDGEDELNFRRAHVELDAQQRTRLTIRPRGGFVMLLD